jgi:hypothetical protein
MKHKLNQLIKPFNPILSINPSEAAFKISKDRHSCFVGYRPKRKQVTESLLKMEQESLVIQNLLEQNGISDFLGNKK